MKTTLKADRSLNYEIENNLQRQTQMFPPIIILKTDLSKKVIPVKNLDYVLKYSMRSRRGTSANK